MFFGVAHEVFRLRRKPKTGAYGSNINAVGSWEESEVEETLLEQAVVAPSVIGGENTGLNRDISSETATLYVPINTDLTPDDRIRWANQLFDVETALMPWMSPFTGYAPGSSVRLKRISG